MRREEQPLGARGHFLYVSWDGPNQWYMESLFFPIFRGIQERLGVEAKVLQFSFAPQEQVRRTHHAAAMAGVSIRTIGTSAHTPLRAVDAARMSSAIIDSVRGDRPIAIVGRSVLPTWMSIMASRRFSLPLVFDADGLPHDERLEDANGAFALRYWTSRGMEQVALQHSDAIIARSKKGRAILEARAGATVSSRRFFVAPNGRNVSQYSPPTTEQRQLMRGRLGAGPTSCIAAHLGSLGAKYRPEWIRAFAESFLGSDPNRMFLLLTGHAELASALVSRMPSDLRSRVQVLAVDASDVPSYLGAIDLGVSFVRESFSSRAVSPIKVGEYLLCGCPVVLSRGVGDLDELVEEAGASLLLVDDPVAAGGRPFKVRELSEEVSAEARRVGVIHFSEQRSIDAYCDALELAVGRG